MFEKRLAAVPPQLLISNGTTDGVVNVASTDYFVVKQKVYLTATSLPNLDGLEVKKILSSVQLIVGPENGNIDAVTDISAYTTPLGAAIQANIQKRPSIPFEEYMRAMYQEEPTVAMRTFIVGKTGEQVDTLIGTDGRRRLAVDADVTVSGISVDLDALTPNTKPDPDNVLVAGSEDGTKNGIKHALKVDSSLKLHVTDVAAETSLTSIDGKLNSLGQKNMAGSVPVVLPSDQASIPVTLADEPVKISGTSNGAPNGTEYTFVNNIKQQILATHDRQQALTYADFGTKNQRVTQIDYTSPTFPSVTARLTLGYTLVGTKYRRDSLTWSIV
jgi:hypothetical protein